MRTWRDLDRKAERLMREYPIGDIYIEHISRGKRLRYSMWYDGALVMRDRPFAEAHAYLSGLEDGLEAIGNPTEVA